MKTKEWEITVIKDGDLYSSPFTFCADNKALAHAHAMHLKNDPGFKHEVLVSDSADDPCRLVGVRMVGWYDEDAAIRGWFLTVEAAKLLVGQTPGPWACHS